MLCTLGVTSLALFPGGLATFFSLRLIERKFRSDREIYLDHQLSDHLPLNESVSLLPFIHEGVKGLLLSNQNKTF